MTSNQKEVKRSSKFNYLMQEDNKDKLSKYDKLNFSPKVYRRTYDQTIKQASLEKQKENMSQNISKCIKSNAKGYSKNAQQQQNSSQKHGLISFGKNRNVEKSYLHQERSSNQHHFVKDETKIRQEGQKNENFNRIRNKSFGSIGIKKPLFEAQDSINEDQLQFSPYQEQNKKNKIFDQGTKFTRSRIEIDPYVSGLDNHGENLLIYQLEEQQLIVRKQLKEYEYQNQLLRKRIQSLQSENRTLKQRSEQHAIELQESELSYQRKLQSLSLDIKELEEQTAIWKLENQQLTSQINSEKRLVNELEQEIHLLASKNQELSLLLNSKDQTIVQLKTKIQLIQIDQLKLIDYEKNKRRKSLDSSTQARKTVLQQKAPHEQSHKISQVDSQDVREYQTQFSKTSNIRKLMNKNYNQEQSHLRFREFSNAISVKQSQVEPFKSIAVEKYINFIESVRTMYSKVTGNESKDLKELWKWLKMITHQYQAFVIFYGMRDSILAVMEDMENRLDASKLQDQLSFMDKECYKIIKKLANVVIKEE